MRFMMMPNERAMRHGTLQTNASNHIGWANKISTTKQLIDLKRGAEATSITNQLATEIPGQPPDDEGDGTKRAPKHRPMSWPLSLQHFLGPRRITLQ